jgi:VCBS repeat protein/ASPIC/UnbV protein
LNIVVTDYNNDGHPDVLVLRGGWWGQNGKYPMSLLRNNGNGTFDDVTEEAGLMSLHPTQTAAWADYDNDGWLDLYVGHEANTTENHPSQLFHNNHDGTFTEVAAPNALADMGFVKGVAWGDFNNDGRPDLYVSVKGKGNHLFRNDGPMDPQNPRPDRWRFTDVTAQAGVAEPIHSFATWFFDYDNDGWPDLYVSGFYVETLNDIAAFQMGLPFKAELPRLYHNNHDGTFTDVTKQMKLDRAILVMGANFGDLDNDGWLDVYLGTGDVPYEALLPNRMFRNNQGKVFQDVTTSGDFGHLQKGHAVAFGDIDNDGDEDVFEEMGGAASGDIYPSVLYENPGHGNHWITVELEGVKTNRAAFGARVSVTVKTAKGVRHIYRTVGYGSSFGGNPLRQHIGVGKAQRIAEVEVTWPTSKLVQTFRDLPVDHAYHLREGAGALAPVEYKKFHLRHLPATAHQH